MSIDLSQFFEVFFEESLEGLDVMESELLNLTPGDLDNETINTIFRAAHSIKGGSGTFGFTHVSDFTHVLETLLDQIREGKRDLQADHVNLLLQSVDCLRAMLGDLQSNQESDLTVANDLKQKFEAILADDGAVPVMSSETSSEASVDQGASDTYEIIFKPKHHLFKTGNEPLYLIEELAELGELDTSVNLDLLPDIHDISADDCYLTWCFYLETDKGESAIQEVFEWVEDDADITITLCGGLFGDEPEQVENETNS